METYRKNATIAGILFLLAIITGISSAGAINILKDPEYIIKASQHGTQILAGSLSLIIMAFACAGIAIWLYPVLKIFNKTLAIGAVGFRIIEAVFHTIATFGIILVLVLSSRYIDSTASDKSFYLTIGAMLASFKEYSSNIGLFAWCIGAAMYYIVFYKSKLIPEWLSAWGIIGIVLATIAVVLSFFYVFNSYSIVHTLLNIPIALQETILAIWLIVKGFNVSVLKSV